MELLKYDSNVRAALKLGYNDLNNDGIDDTLLTLWNSKRVAFISDDGVLPWSEAEEGRDWNAYFNEAFNVGSEPPVTWNEMRNNWGNYYILVDKDDRRRNILIIILGYSHIPINCISP